MASARGNDPIVFIGSGPPTGTPQAHWFYVDSATGELYDALLATWHLVSAGAGGVLKGVNVQAGDYVAVPGDDRKLIVMTKATAKTLTLLATPPSLTWAIWIQNTGAGTLTIDRNGLTIDSAASNLSLIQGEGIFLSTDGSNYFTERGFPPLMVGDSGSGGKKGAAPAPASGDAAAGKFLKADATWTVPSGTGAPTDAKYVTVAAHASLSAEVIRQQLGNFFAETYPASPNSMDDEFDDTSGMSGPINGLDARWTWRNQGAAAIAWTMAGWVDMTMPASATENIRIIEQTLPAGDWGFEAKISLEGQRTNASSAGIALIDATNGDLYSFGVGVQTSNTDPIVVTVSRYTNVTTFLSQTFGPNTVSSNKIFFRVIYTSGTTTLAWWMSLDGIGWVRLGTTVDAVGVTRIGLYADELNNLGLTKLHCDYFRRIT